MTEPQVKIDSETLDDVHHYMGTDNRLAVHLLRHHPVDCAECTLLIKAHDDAFDALRARVGYRDVSARQAVSQ